MQLRSSAEYSVRWWQESRESREAEDGEENQTQYF
jgi:hypothetical protein